MRRNPVETKAFWPSGRMAAVLRFRVQHSSDTTMSQVSESLAGHRHAVDCARPPIAALAHGMVWRAPCEVPVATDAADYREPLPERDDRCPRLRGRLRVWYRPHR